MASDAQPASPNADEWRLLCRLNELTIDAPRRYVLPPIEPIAVCRTVEGIFVVSDTCTHAQASLSEGEVMDGQIFCPFHGGAFDLRTGQPTKIPCTIPIVAYEARIKNGEVFIRTPAFRAPTASE
jgi:nitrite reductase/ring-hydroxylating ferredoxin subunit